MSSSPGRRRARAPTRNERRHGAGAASPLKRRAMRRFDFSQPDFQAAFRAFVDERRETPDEVDAVVRDVIAAVRAEGLTALLRFARAYDGVELDERSIRVTEAEIEAGAQAC